MIKYGGINGMYALSPLTCNVTWNITFSAFTAESTVSNSTLYQRQIQTHFQFKEAFLGKTKRLNVKLQEVY